MSGKIPTKAKPGQPWANTRPKEEADGYMSQQAFDFLQTDYSEVIDPVLDRTPFTLAIATIYAVLDKLSTQDKAILKARVIEHFSKRGLQRKTFELYVKDLERILEHKLFSYKVQNAKTVAAYIYQSMNELFPEIIKQVTQIAYSPSDIEDIGKKVAEYKEKIAQINKEPETLTRELIDELEQFTTESTLKLAMLEQQLREIFDSLEDIRLAKEYAEGIYNFLKQSKKRP